MISCALDLHKLVRNENMKWSLQRLILLFSSAPSLLIIRTKFSRRKVSRVSFLPFFSNFVHMSLSHQKTTSFFLTFWVCLLLDLKTCYQLQGQFQKSRFFAGNFIKVKYMLKKVYIHIKSKQWTCRDFHTVRFYLFTLSWIWLKC